MIKSLVFEIIQRIESVISRQEQGDFVPLHTPEFSGNEKDYLIDCIDSNFVSSVGEFVDRYERMLEAYTGAKRAVVTVNGTAALHAALHLMGVTAGDEVLVPAFTFIATANAVSYCGATSHFIDVEEKTLGVDPEKLRTYLGQIGTTKYGQCCNRHTGALIKAIVPMHAFGHPVRMHELVDVCQEFGIVVVEDAAESLGSFYKEVHTGNFGKLAALSFNGNKIITTGGGGAILTNDEELGRLAKHVTTTAKVPHRWEFVHDRIGFNYRMPALNAALGCAQMEQLPDMLKRKRTLAMKYAKAFSDIEGVKFFAEPEHSKSNYWLNALVLEKEDLELRDVLLEQTNDAGLMTRPVWTLMHQLSMFKDNPRMDLAAAESLSKRIVNIPSSANLG
jgi:perosamine synthetase